MDPAAAVLAALLTIFPQTPARACLERRAPSIARALADAQATRGVPMALFLAVAWRETWASCHPRAYGGWGAPRDFQHRGEAGTADDAAAVLQHGLAQCHAWPAAVRWFRTGSCTTAAHADYVAAVMGLSRRLDAVRIQRP